MTRWTAVVPVWIACSCVLSAQGVESAAKAPYLNFESGPVNALLLSPDAMRLYVLDTADARVEVYALPSLTGASAQSTGRPTSASEQSTAAPLGPASGGALGSGPPWKPLTELTYLGSVLTGLEPVAMCLDPADSQRLFVSNHVSDSVSVVDLGKLQVVATIPVGDEPQGLAVTSGKLFVACARAEGVVPSPSQVVPGPLVENVVAVHSASAPYARLALLPISAVRPRDVVVADGTVYVIPQNSGNHTTLLDELGTAALGLVQDEPDGFDPPFAVNPVLQRPEFAAFARGWGIPTVGRIVFDSEHPGLVPQLLDRDIVAISPAGPSVLPGATTGVATTLLDLARNPATGALWVAGTESRNRTRFEPNLRGAALENRVVIAAPGGGVLQTLVLAPPFTSREHAQPALLEFLQGSAAVAAGARAQSGVGTLAFVGCLGSASVLALDATSTALLAEIDTGEIPGGLAADAARGVLWVYSRGEHSLRAYDVAQGFHALGPPRPLAYDPEPLSVSAGRTHLYDARAETGHGNGNMSCASCHVFGHHDQLAWDLGNPGGGLGYYYPDVLGGLLGFAGEIATAPSTAALNPLKGPMITQSLRGLLDPDTIDSQPLHWRGDRRTFHMFRGAFDHLLGGSGISKTQTQSFATFLRSMRYAPNPRQPKDRQYVGLEAQGRDLYGMNPAVPGKEFVGGTGFLCIACHVGDFTENDDFTGTHVGVNKGSFTQVFNPPTTRMLYEVDYKYVSGFGALHDGAVDGVRGFMDFKAPGSGLPVFPNYSTPEKDGIANFLKAWDAGLSPLVGQQWTLRADTLAQANAVLDLFEAQAKPPASNVDLILKGFRYDLSGTLLARGAHFRLDPVKGWGYRFDTGEFASRSVVLSAVPIFAATFTFTCVPPGQGERLGIDRDEDGLWDWKETLAGTDPARPDTDGDGYLDGAEAALGGNPLVADAALPDATPPAVQQPRALETFVDSTTIAFTTDEPTTAVVEIGTTPGGAQVATVAAPGGLRREHDVAVLGLPAGTTLFFEVTATDRNGNAGTALGSFATLPPFFHVESIELSKSGGSGGPYTVQARVLVLDHRGLPVVGVPVRGFWAGDIGGQPWDLAAPTDATGWATLELQPFTPAAPTTVAFSPAYVGSPSPSNPWFVGFGAQAPTFFYDEPSNAAHFATVAVP